jgi:uncharacterized NAD-dependent epimerase/dehydratase family protein
MALPSVGEMIELCEGAIRPLRPAPVIAVALNTYDLDDETARRTIEQVQRETGLPTTDVVRYDPAPVADAIARFHQTRAR